MFERSIINRCYSDNDLKQQILQGAYKHGAQLFNLLLVPSIFLGQKLQQKIMRNKMVFTLLKFQDNLSCIFADFSAKGAKSKVSNYLLVDSVVIVTSCLKMLLQNYSKFFLKIEKFTNGFETKFI